NNPHSLLSAYGCAAVTPFARAAVAFYCCRATVAPLARAACRSVAVAPPSLLLSIAAMAPPTLVLLRSLSIELTRIMYRFQSHLQFQLEIPYFRTVAEDLPYSYYSAAQTMNSGTVDQLFTSEWHFVYQEASSPASAWGSDHATDINDLGLHRTILTDEEENDCDFVYDISRDAKRNGFEFTDAIDSETIFDTKVDWPDRGHKYSTKKKPNAMHLAGDSLIPEAISKKCIEDAKVLHQVDKKFIPVVASATLAVIDQHAADERIRLEELRQKKIYPVLFMRISNMYVLSEEAKGITYLDAEQELQDASYRCCQRLVINYFIVIANRLKIGVGCATFMFILNLIKGIWMFQQTTMAVTLIV
ncbi:hypothetical protein S245_023630, partial [Arachis hypogaea]